MRVPGDRDNGEQAGFDGVDFSFNGLRGGDACEAAVGVVWPNEGSTKSKEATVARAEGRISLFNFTENSFDTFLSS